MRIQDRRTGLGGAVGRVGDLEGDVPIVVSGADILGAYGETRLNDRLPRGVLDPTEGLPHRAFRHAVEIGEYDLQVDVLRHTVHQTVCPRQRGTAGEDEPRTVRAEERRVGTGCVRTGRSRGWQDNK